MFVWFVKKRHNMFCYAKLRFFVEKYIVISQIFGEVTFFAPNNHGEGVLFRNLLQLLFEKKTCLHNKKHIISF